MASSNTPQVSPLSTASFTLVLYDIIDNQLEVEVNKNIGILVSDMNALIATARLISNRLEISTDADWTEMKYVKNPRLKHVAKHVAIHSFFGNDDVLYTPVPNLSLHKSSFVTGVELRVLVRRHELAVEHNSLKNALFNESTPISSAIHSQPTYAAIVFRDYAPFDNFNEIHFGGSYMGTNECWNYYTVPELPDDSQLASLKGIVLSGGRYSSCDPSIPWLNTVMAFLRKVYLEYPNIRVIGNCLGCQILACSLGGETCKDPVYPFIYGVETVRTNDAFKAEVKGLPTDLVITEVHEDKVAKLPECAVLYGSSNTCEVEVWGVPGRILGLQGHSEYSHYYAQHLVSSQILASGAITAEEAANINTTFEMNRNEMAKVLPALKNWLKSN